ncbi:MAG TPA: hypothetical protein VGS22_24410 [Thermoanaerobaculia bacterium]|jgi:hypothetical protein|nr:hypothetical protein [Thermoanaerobaculia bacterium]
MMTRQRLVITTLSVALAISAQTAALHAQAGQPADSSPSTMTECEGVDNCATWTFLGVQGNGQWRTGEVANLYFESVRLNADKSVDVVIHRADSTGSAAGLTAVYKGNWRDGRVGGEFTSSWPGHWKSKAGNWYAMTEAPLSLPNILHLCAHDHCLTYTWQDGHFTNYTNLPYQANEKRVLTVKSFTRDSIVFYDTEIGSYPLTATWTGRVSQENHNIADGTVVITSWGGKPTQNPVPAPFKLAWGAALELLPGSDEASGLDVRQTQPQTFTGEDALNFLYWMQFFKGMADLLGGNN